jgi:hypothetical protein
MQRNGNVFATVILALCPACASTFTRARAAHTLRTGGIGSFPKSRDIIADIPPWQTRRVG